MRSVKRFHHEPTLRTQNLLEHSGMVALLFIYFAKYEAIEYDASVLELLLKHDLLETYTGDLPYPAKNHNQLTKDCWGAIEEAIIQDSAYSDIDGCPLLRRYTDEKIKETLSERQYKLFKVVDLLDIWIFLKEDQALGNHTSACNRIIELCESKVSGLFRSVDHYMRNANHF